MPHREPVVGVEPRGAKGIRNLGPPPPDQQGTLNGKGHLLDEASGVRLTWRSRHRPTKSLVGGCKTPVGARPLRHLVE